MKKTLESIDGPGIGPGAQVPQPPRSGVVRRLEHRLALPTVVLPAIGFAAALVWSRIYGFSAIDAILLIVMFSITTLGITAGYHRLFSHGSFQATKSLEAFLGVAGSMAAQGPLIFWTACHRRHHQHSDRELDPHSPQTGEPGWLSRLRGLWYAHMGWMLDHEEEDWMRYAPDLLRSRRLIEINFHYFTWIGLGLALPAAAGGLLSLSWEGAVSGFLWGGLARIFLVHQTTWSINSICHVFGSRPFRNGDDSANNLLCALWAFGEGWHNNHHAFPSSARQGLEPGQPDITYAFLRLCERAGWARDLKLPPPESIAAKRRTESEST